MTNGKIVAEIRALVSEQEIPEDVGMRLLLSAVAEIYEKLGPVCADIGNMKPWVGAWKWFVLLIGPLAIVGVLGFLISVLTNQVIITFP